MCTRPFARRVQERESCGDQNSTGIHTHNSHTASMETAKLTGFIGGYSQLELAPLVWS